MKKEGYYSSGQFAKMAHISIRTVRYYDKQGLLKPSYVTEKGARFYTENDFSRLQQIMLFKYLGFSLEDIRELLAPEADYQFLANSLELQKKLIQDRIWELQRVEQAITDTTSQIREEKQVDGRKMLDLIHLTNMESSLKTQYQNSSNISARIQLHRMYSTNRQGWFPWVFEQCHLQEGERVLELGCGNGGLWIENLDKIPQKVDVVLSDYSQGMIRELAHDSRLSHSQFRFAAFDCQSIPYEKESFDLIIANHMLFYCDDREQALCEIARVLRPRGRVVFGTYGSNHMKEITELVREFDERIVLSADNLYEKFGRENGAEQLERYFEQVAWLPYEDKLVVKAPEPLMEYILSCHGNQNQYILNKYNKFRSFVESKVKKPFEITKEAGVFVGRKKKTD